MISAQVFVPQIPERQRVAVGGEKRRQSSKLARVGPDRVRAAVGLQLEPAQIFGGSGLQIDCHVEAVSDVAILDRYGGRATRDADSQPADDSVGVW